MNAITVYVNAAKLVLQLTDSNWSGIQELYRILPQLRQLLACAVCCRLVSDPYVPRHGRCHHNVCRLCVRGQKKLQPLCNYCKDNRDYKCYDENKQMRCLLLCYKGLCDHLKSSSIYQQLMMVGGGSGRKLQATYNTILSNITNSNSTMPQTLHELIVEGTTYDEITVNNNIVNNNNNYNNTCNSIQQQTVTTTKTTIASSGHTKLPQLPALVSPLSTTAAVTPLPPAGPLTTSYQSVPPKASTPPTTAHNNFGETLPTITKLKCEQYSPPLVIGQQKQFQQQQQQQQQQLQQTQRQLQQQQHQQHAPPLQALTTVATTTSTSTPTPTSIPNQTHSTIIQLNQLPKNSTGNSITYIGANARGIVVPIVSSSITTTAPLTIASARLQSLNRQLAQARIINTTSSASSSSISQSPSLVSSSVSISAPSSASCNSIELKPKSTIGTTYKVSLATNANTVHLTKSITGLTANNNNNNNRSSSSNINRINSLNASVCATPIRHPPPIKTVSNGSAMYSVLYTGIGNKITIKRKTDGDDDANQKRTIATSTITTKTTTAPTGASISTSTKTSLPIEATAAAATGALADGTTSTSQKSSNKNNANKRRGCRCGNATPTPGKLTCCGQRCPCYVDSKSCIGCKCRGCRNPHRPGGGKVRPIIPELACYEIQMADEHSNPLGGSHDMPLTSNAMLNRNVTVAPSGINNFSNITGSISTATTTSCTISNNNNSNNNIIKQTSTNGTHATPSSNSTNATISTNQLLGYCESNDATPPPLAPTTTPIIHNNNNQPNHVTHSASNTTTIQSNTATNILQLEHLPRESVLVQNAQGKYQVLNLFTTSSPSSTASSMSGTQMANGGQQLPSLQRIQQSLAKVGGSGGSSATFAANSYILNTTHTTANATPTATSNSNSNSTLSQIILQAKQHQQQQQQQQQQHLLTTATQRNVVHANSNNHNNSNNVTTITANSPLTIPLQLQQQLKQNVITVHTINSPMNTITNHLNNHTTSILTITSNATPIHTTATTVPTLTGITTELRPIGATANLYTNTTSQNNNSNNHNATLNISSGPTTFTLPATTAATTINNRNCIMGNVVTNHHHHQSVTRTIRTAGIIDIFDTTTKAINHQ